jgi:hypothetical protein
VVVSRLERALEDMFAMDRSKPYALNPEDAKRRLVNELRSISTSLDIPMVVIGGLAVAHHGYARITRDVDILVSREQAGRLLRYLRSLPRWRRTTDGFLNVALEVKVDICVEGDVASPRSGERFPDPRALSLAAVKPLPVPRLADLISLKVKSSRARDDADVVELLKLSRPRWTALRKRVLEHLSTGAARGHFDSLVERARDELERDRLRRR